MPERCETCRFAAVRWLISDDDGEREQSSRPHYLAPALPILYDAGAGGEKDLAGQATGGRFMGR